MTNFPQCQKRGLLRTLYGSTIVSSAALYHELGNTEYQRFIRHGQLSRKPEKGFQPADVEAWLQNSETATRP